MRIERMDPGLLHPDNWVMALFGEEAQEEAFATRPFLAPLPLRRPAAASPSTAASGCRDGGRGPPA